MEKVTTWRGRRIDELSRDELIDALAQVVEKLQTLQASEAIVDRAWGRVRRPSARD